MPIAILAERASMSRTTLNKFEKGDPTVSTGSYAVVLFKLGVIDRLSDIADPRHDAAGREVEKELLRQRIRFARRKNVSPDDAGAQ